MPALEQAAESCPEAAPSQIDGEPNFVAMDAYYLQEEATRSLRAGLTEAPYVEEVFAKASALGVKVLRTNGFNDDPAKTGDSCIQVARLQYDETSLRGLDYVLNRAEAHGLRLILPLGNSWDDYGGQRQYAVWNDLPNVQDEDPRFFTDPGTIAHYKQHIANLLNRTNTFDGIRYGDHPAVLAWELLNEPRATGLDSSGSELRAWVDELGAHVKSLSSHWVGTGEEGFDLSPDGYDAAFWTQAAPIPPFTGTGSFTKNTASPSVDIASVHLFPESWGWSTDQVAQAGAKWISEHAAIARAVGKPLLVGEFGLRNAGAFTLADRRAMYAGWFACARKTGAAGISPWMFAYDARPDSWDMHTFYFRDGTMPDDPMNRYADLILAAAPWK